MLDFQVPQIKSETVEETRGSFTIEPLDRGFGYTFGNSLRRVLLSSLAGAAVTSVRIEGVAHEFSTIEGVKEDVTDIVLNLKGVVCRMHSDATEIEASVVAKGPGVITAADIDLPAGVEVLSPDVHIATLEQGTSLEMYLTIGRGRGYRPSDENKSPDQPIGVIPIDSIFSPVRRVAYAVEQARVGQKTDFDKLTLDIETDGSIDPKGALREAAEVLIQQLAIFTDARGSGDTARQILDEIRDFHRDLHELQDVVDEMYDALMPADGPTIRKPTMIEPEPPPPDEARERPNPRSRRG